MFISESQQANKARLLLSAATAPDPARMGAYNIPELNKSVVFYFSLHLGILFNIRIE
jgi:hypothetical protein